MSKIYKNTFLKIYEVGTYFFRFFRPRQKKPYTVHIGILKYGPF